ncbi:MAG TPA: zinc-binding dehydrogenase [Solirubrobacteraceae bacterium]|jgi:NADPH2:quinone reductase|nr:zinc-binding dehydrogenase [Solirubrobacteraceae bacterium]
MQAVVVHEPGGPGVLKLEERPIPDPTSGWVLVRVRAFGLNHSELITRAGGSGDAVRFPRVLGIECVGEVVLAPGSDLTPGQRIVAAMGGMGRDFDGGYEQYALLPASQAIPVRTTLEWPQLGAIPESFGTAWGTLEQLELSAGQSLLVHGGTSSVGMAAIAIAADRGLTVLATTRQQAKRAALVAAGARHVIVSAGDVTAVVRELLPDGVDGICELIGPGALLQALPALAPGGRVCMTGFLEGDWNTERVEAQAGRLGVQLRHFGSGVINRDSYGAVFQEIIEAVQDGRYAVNLDRVFAMSEIADAHRYMEADRAVGKVVGLAPQD